ncbi:hypothetical protein B0H67DRAFT_645353 [Lasiosphaeris hirsuta]|uniref:Uncharacterized protein n=1 Tax=Lasiosphaeris hirsuta TaxID=260670 RepID=A0AA40AGX2_9PEZI|nr:hypothetical protein B0H67DRAFT_645353 [Lasiosphaeris hirsuta]
MDSSSTPASPSTIPSAAPSEDYFTSQPTPASPPSSSTSDSHDPPYPHQPKRPPLHLRTAGRSNQPTPPTPHLLFAQPWVSVSGANSSLLPMSPLTLDPRPLEELYNERAYLLQILQRQDERATRLFERYAAVETQMVLLQTSEETPGGGKKRGARKLKKEAAAVKSRITEGTQQEQLMMLRLGEIHVEMQNRERWMGVRQRLVHQSAVFGQLGTPLTAAAMLPDYFSAESTLSPLSPSFVPGTAAPEDVWGQEVAGTSSTHKESEDKQPPVAYEDSPTIPQTDEFDEKGLEVKEESKVGSEDEEESDQIAVEGVAWDTDSEEDSGQDREIRTWRKRLSSISLSRPFSLRARDKRMSMPSLKAAWERPTAFDAGKRDSES